MTARRAPTRPCVVAVGGVDPSGGAGLAADLRAVAAAGAWGCPVVATLTVQSTAGVRAVEPVGARLVAAQLREVALHQRLRACKTGALGSVEVVREVTRFARAHAALALVVDPVMLPTRGARGARLVDADALDALRALIARATLVTPNAHEAEVLTGVSVVDERSAARAGALLVASGARFALVKGGHFGARAVDVLVSRAGVVRVAGVRRARARVHGAGCTLASAIAGRLACCPGALRDEDVVAAVRWAKRRVAVAFRHATVVGEGLRVLPL